MVIACISWGEKKKRVSFFKTCHCIYFSITGRCNRGFRLKWPHTHTHKKPVNSGCGNNMIVLFVPFFFSFFPPFFILIAQLFWLSLCVIRCNKIGINKTLILTLSNLTTFERKTKTRVLKWYFGFALTIFCGCTAVLEKSAAYAIKKSWRSERQTLEDFKPFLFLFPLSSFFVSTPSNTHSR